MPFFVIDLEVTMHQKYLVEAETESEAEQIFQYGHPEYLGRVTDTIDPAFATRGEHFYVSDPYETRKAALDEDGAVEA